MNERIWNPWASLILAQWSTSEFMRFFLEYRWRGGDKTKKGRSLVSSRSQGSGGKSGVLWACGGCGYLLRKGKLISLIFFSCWALKLPSPLELISVLSTPVHLPSTCGPLCEPAGITQLGDWGMISSVGESCQHLPLGSRVHSRQGFVPIVQLSKQPCQPAH